MKPSSIKARTLSRYAPSRLTNLHIDGQDYSAITVKSDLISIMEALIIWIEDPGPA